MGSEGNADCASVTTVVHKFGDEDLSDVTLIVGEEEFKCHKAFLATRSSYFKAMFFSNFKEKDQDKVTIQADPISFKRLMELIYTAEFTDGELLLDCSTSCNGCLIGTSAGYPHTCNGLVTTVWNDLTALLQLADLFDVRSYTVALLERHLLSSYICKCNNCPCSGAKLLIALTNDMHKFKKKSTMTRTAVSVVLREISKESAVLISPTNLDWLLWRA